MSDVRVLVKLVIGDDGDTWVASAPVRHHIPNRTDGIVAAAGEALAYFVGGIKRDAELIVERIVKEECA